MIEGTLLQYMREQLDLTSLDFKRYLYDVRTTLLKLNCHAVTRRGSAAARQRGIYVFD